MSQSPNQKARGHNDRHNSTQLSERQIKALQIAATSKLTRKGKTWIVPSQAGQRRIQSASRSATPRCTCPDFEFRNAKCKHVLAVEYTLMRETTPDGGRPLLLRQSRSRAKPTRKTGKPTTAAQTQEKSELQALLYELCKNLPEPEQRKGKGRPRCRLPDIIFASVTKIYSTISGRRFATDLRDAKARGYLMPIAALQSVCSSTLNPKR